MGAVSPFRDPALKARWVFWRTLKRKGKPTKVPMNPATGEPAKSNDASTWSTRPRAQEWPQSDGVGLMLGDLGDGRAICGVDLDSCRDPETGKLAPWAKRVIDALDSYTEVSPSGEGVKVFFLLDAEHGLKGGSFVEHGHAREDHPPAIEVYFSGRFFTVTDDAIGKRDLRHVSADDVRDVLDEGRKLAKAPSDASKPAQGDSDLSAIVANRPLDFTRKQVKMILRNLDEEEWCEPREAWLKVGAALHHQYEGDDEGLGLWDWFSEVSDKFDADDSERVWKSFKPRRDPITMATLKDAAKRSTDWDEDKFRAAGDDAPEESNKRKRSATLDIYWGEADDGVDDLEPLIDDFLFQQSLGAIYGKYGEAKTFVALDMALSVATGRPWLGREVTQGAVLYVAPEGYIGLKQRREAWCKHHRIGRAPKDFALVRGSLNLQKPDGVTLEALAAAAKERRAKLIIIDTLNAVFGGGDENESAAMSKARHELERLRDLSGAAVLVVHHAGKDIDRGLRGSSVLGGALDTVLLVNGGRIISKAPKGKQKDMEPADDIAFTLKSIELAPDKKGRPRSSLAIEAGSLERFDDLSEQDEVALRALARAQGMAEITGDDVVTVADWRERFYKSKAMKESTPAARKKAFQRAKAALTEAGHVRIDGQAVFSR